MTYPIRLVTWNVAGRVARHAEQARVVAAVDADIVALQEVTARTLPMWQTNPAQAGYLGCQTALGTERPASGRRPLGVLTAAREPLARRPGPTGVPWPERVLCCTAGDVEVIKMHSPIAPAADLAKVRTHEAVAAYLASGSTPGPRGPLR